MDIRKKKGTGDSMDQEKQKGRCQVSKEEKDQNEKLKIGKSDYYDFNLVAVIILIMCFGLIMFTVQALTWHRLMKGTICFISRSRQCTV